MFTKHITYCFNCLLLLITVGFTLIFMQSCDSCGDKKAGTLPQKTKKTHNKHTPRPDTTAVDSMTLDSLLNDSLLNNAEKVDSIDAQADSLDNEEQADSILDDNLLTPEQFAIKNFVEVKTIIPDVIEEIRYCSDHNFVGRRISGYLEPVALMTREGAEALKKAADELRKKGYRIKIFDAYRPDDAVQHFRRWVGDLNDQKMKDEFYPDIDKELLFKEGYISSRSKHCHGSTVDLTICDTTGVEIDMGGHFDFFSETSHANYTDSLTDLQINNRAVLRKAMENNGFKVAGTEWWHFSLVDEPYPETSFNFPVKRLQNMLSKTNNNTNSINSKPAKSSNQPAKKHIQSAKKNDKPAAIKKAKTAK